jgi:hypothetical protein
MGIKGRLKVFLKLNNISKIEFYKSINVPSGYTDKDLTFSSKILIKIIKSYPNLSIKWLLIGEGNMLENGEDNILKVSCDEANCLKNYAIKLQQDKIKQLENLDSDDSTFPNFYNLN